MKNKLIILDLDETLIHALDKPLDYQHDFKVGPYFIYKRPFLAEFIAYCFSEFKVAVWTSSSESYAQGVVNAIFENIELLEFIWSRDRCVNKFDPETREFIPVKDLKKTKNRGYSLETTIMIDDTPEKLMRQYGNLVRVKPYVGSREDEELKKLIIYLDELKRVANVRTIDKRVWRNTLPYRN